MIFLSSVLVFKPKALCNLGKYSTTKLYCWHQHCRRLRHHRHHHHHEILPLVILTAVSQGSSSSSSSWNTSSIHTHCCLPPPTSPVFSWKWGSLEVCKPTGELKRVCFPTGSGLAMWPSTYLSPLRLWFHLHWLQFLLFARCERHEGFLTLFPEKHRISTGSMSMPSAASGVTSKSWQLSVCVKKKRVRSNFWPSYRLRVLGGCHLQWISISAKWFVIVTSGRDSQTPNVLAPLSISTQAIANFKNEKNRNLWNTIFFYSCRRKTRAWSHYKLSISGRISDGETEAHRLRNLSLVTWLVSSRKGWLS